MRCIPHKLAPARRYTQFCQAVNSGAVEEAVRVHEELLTDLYAVQSHMHRLEAAAGAFRREQAVYAEQQEKLRVAITQAESDIEERKQQLQEARAEVARQQEYEVVKQQVTRVPARSATRAEMAAVNREISDLTQQRSMLEAVMRRRRIQFAAIAHVVDGVHGGLGGEGQEEGQAPVGDNAGAQPMQEG